MGDRLRAGIPSRYVTSQLGQLNLYFYFYNQMNRARRRCGLMSDYSDHLLLVATIFINVYTLCEDVHEIK